jgi:hypothetical protein
MCTRVLANDFFLAVLRRVRVVSKHELKDRVMVVMDDNNQHPVVLRGPIGLIRLHDYDSNHENAELEDDRNRSL